jgi:predicted flap endonuclease-1-like 5' DNA nuclease
MNPAQFNLIELAGMALIVLAVAWLVFGRRKTVRQRYRTPDALDEGVGPAARNQALIDAPSARVAALAGSGPDLGGLGELIAAGAAEEVATPAPAVAAAVPGGSELLRIKGLGPKLAARLGELGVTTLAQVAAWDAGALETIDAQLGAFAGRPARDRWVDQAQLLSAGDMAAYRSEFGNL